MNKKIFVLLAVLMMLLSGCYFGDDVKTNEVGAQLNKNKVINCVGPGVYNDAGFFSDLVEVDVSTLTLEVEDQEVVTSDNQLVGVRITVQARRRGDCESVTSLLSNWSTLLDDDVLKQTIDATAREGIKNGTRSFTLQELLDDRNGLADSISEKLSEDSGKYHVQIVNVTIENIGIAEEYADIMQATAQLKAEEDYQQRRQSLVQQQAETDLFERQQQQLVLNEQLKLEEKQTEIDIEIARREGAKIAATQSVYENNDRAYELERLRLTANIIGDKSVIYFIPEGTDLTVFVSETELTPVSVE